MEVNEDENLAVEALGQLGNCCRTWNCESCDVLFFTESEYNDHLQTHSENENIEYPCSKCEEKFKVKVALDAHELTHLTSEKLEYQCDVCFMWFQRLSSLKNHEKVHLPNTLKDFLNKNKQKRNYKQLHSRRNKRNANKEPPSPAFELIASSAYSSRENSEDENTNDNEDFYKTEENGCNNIENRTKEINNENVIPNIVNNLPSLDVCKPHACLFCAKKFAREKALLSHMKLHDDNFEAIFLTCAKCDSSFDDLPSLQDHVASCLTIKTEPVDVESDGSDDYFNPFVAKSTSKKYLNIPSNKRIKKEFVDDYDRSTLFKVSTGKYACDQCTKSFKTRQKLFRHVWIHRAKEHHCKSCDSSFYTAGKLEDHVNMFHSAEAHFICDECGKGYTTQKSLSDHKHYHLVKSRELSCPYCKKIFSSRQGFTIHQRIHTGERPYICEYCSKPFRDGATLRKHELIHTGERPFKCPICDSAFNQKVVLREHIRGVHAGKAKKNICELCKEVKSDSESLSEHLVKHSDEIRGPVIPRKRNPFIIRWTGEEMMIPKKKSTVVKIGVRKKGRPKMSDHSNKKKLKKKKTVVIKRQRNMKGVKHMVAPVRKSTRERKVNQGFSNYIQEDLDLLLELSREDESIKNRNISDDESETSSLKTPTKKKKSVKPKTRLKSVTKRKRKSFSQKYKDENVLSNHNSEVDSKIEVKSTIILGAGSNDIEYPTLLSFTEICAMCNERFSSREDLLTHVSIHI